SIASMQNPVVDPSRRAVPQILWAGIFGLILGVLTVESCSLPRRWALLLMAALLFIFTLPVIKSLRKLLLAIILCDIPFRIDIHLGFREEVARLGSDSGFDVSVTTIALTILYAMWLSEFLSKRARTPRLSLQSYLPLVLYLAFAALSVSVASDVT